MKDFFEELWDEASDFFEDLFENLKGTPKKTSRKTNVVIDGAIVAVRPAYLFAERIDNYLKIVFGVSIIISSFTATFYGFATLSELIKSLIFSFLGRLIMFMIGFSYFVIGLWKLMRMRQNSRML